MSETVTSKVDFQVMKEILESFDYKKSYLIAMLQKVQSIYKEQVKKRQKLRQEYGKNGKNKILLWY